MPTQPTPTTTRHAVYLAPEDEQAIAAIKARHGHASLSSAIRYTVRRLNEIERAAQRKAEKAS